MKFPSKDLLGLTALWKTRALTKQGVHWGGVYSGQGVREPC